MSPSRHGDPRREAWRRFYLENYPEALKAVGNEKPKLDAYIVALWKSIGSKGREVYINAERNKTSNAEPSEKPAEPGITLKAKKNIKSAKSTPSEVEKVEESVQRHAPNRHSGKPVHDKTRNRHPDVKPAEKSKAFFDLENQANGSAWPRKLTSRLCQCVMLTRKQIRLSVNENVELSVSSVKELDRRKQSSSTVVRLNKNGREFARLDSSFANSLGAAMQTGLVNATCSIVQAPVSTGFFSAFYGEVSIYIERAAFVDSEEESSSEEGMSTLRMTVIQMIRDLNLILDPGTKRLQVVDLEKDKENCADEEENIDSFLSSVNRIEVTDAKDFAQPRNLRSSLREYQRAGVQWMINRENFGCPVQPSDSNQGQSNYLWKKCTSEDGEGFFVNPVTGELRLQITSTYLGGPRGGILADEMGLGKTVQCIACLLQDSEETRLRPEPPISKSTETEQESRTVPMYETDNGRGVNVARRPAKKKNKNSSPQVTHTASAASLLMANARDSGMLGGTLIICPTSLVTQWMDELSFHVKPSSLRILAHYGNVRGDETSICAKFADVVVTSYGVLASEFQPGSDVSASSTECGPLFKLKWRRVILDEAHTIKSRSTRWARAAYRLEADRRWCVTGTVIHNHINDAFSLIHFLRLEPWSTWGVWSKSVADPLESKEETVRESAMALVRDILSSVILRRKKSTRDSDGNAIVQMTKKTVQVVSLTPSSEERDFYAALHARTKMKFNSFLAQGNVLKNYASVLEMLLRLRQACDHPYLVVSASKAGKERNFDNDNIPDASHFNSSSSKKRAFERMEGSIPSTECPLCLDIAEDAVCLPECGHVLCRACLTEALQTFQSCPFCKKPTDWKDGNSSLRTKAGVDLKTKWSSSAKIDELMKDLTEQQSLRKRLGREIGKSVVFSQFAKMLDITEIALRRANFSFLRIDGSVPQSKRAMILKQFSAERELSRDACNVLLLSTRAGGVGLNLTSASFAVILDIHWNPQVDAQAQDRIHRHGQTRDVEIKRYIVKDSVEEKLLEVQARKEKLAEGALEEANEGDDRQARLKELKLLFSG